MNIHAPCRQSDRPQSTNVSTSIVTIADKGYAEERTSSTTSGRKDGKRGIVPGWLLKTGNNDSGTCNMTATNLRNIMMDSVNAQEENLQPIAIFRAMVLDLTQYVLQNGDLFDTFTAKDGADVLRIAQENYTAVMENIRK